MDDSISRRVAIDTALEFFVEFLDGAFHEKSQEIMIAKFRAIPPTEPERKTGKWITVDKGLIVTSYKCSECGRTVRDDTGYDVCKDYPYCHCGARMEG